MKNQKNRRAFLDTVGKTALGAALIAAVPGKLFASNSKGDGSKKNTNVEIHPMAIKRNNKG
jgi:hypothetical protein